MPLEKESLNNFLPNGFETLNQEGYKENFAEDKIVTGFEKDVPDIISGPNFNNLLDVVGKNTNVLTKFMDFIKNMPINNLFSVDENNQLVYKNLDEVGGGSSFSLFDTVLKDHILSFDESKGFALLGTYVYKTGVSGTRYGYPDFYNKCVAEMNAGEDFIIRGNAITLPTFTANTTKGITISDSRGNTTNLQKLFNNANTNTADDVQIGSWSTYWINIDYGQPTYLKNYKICSDNNSTPEYPSAWTIQGSNDGENYDVLGTVTGETFTLNYCKTYSQGSGTTQFKQTKPYNQYRIVFSNGIESSNNGELGFITFNAEKVITGKKNANGHIFYDISDKELIDEIYESTGFAWYYGVDEENERIFLSRKDLIEVTPKSSLTVYGNGRNLMVTNGTVTSPLCIKGPIGGGARLMPANNGEAQSKLPNSVGDNDKGSTDYGNNDGIGVATSGNTGLVLQKLKQDTTKYIYMVVGNTEQESAITDVVDVTTTENDTVPLFTAQYFDFTPNNVSWLKAGEQANSGGIYATCYNELVNELTNPKYGLKVIETSAMQSGEDYSEYWQVNQDEMYFVTPTKLSYKALNGGVKGNGLTLGLTNGKNNGGLSGFSKGSSNAAISYLANYGQPVGATTTGTSQTGSLGITTDPTKSGVIAEESTAQLYFKVANAVQNLELLDVGEVMETLTGKTDSVSAANASMPSDKCIDLTLGESGSKYTAPANGWYVLRKKATEIGQYMRLATSTGLCAEIGSTFATQVLCIYVPVRKGDILTITYSLESTSEQAFYFIYAGGEI